MATGLVRTLKNLYQLIKGDSRFSYRLEEIDAGSNKVIVCCRGLRTIIKTSLEEAICNSALISGLSPMESCILGGYFGRALKNSQHSSREISKKAGGLSFLLSNKKGQYCMAFQNRSGEVGYFDQKTKKEFLAHPLEIARNPSLISKFDSSQACYIGVLAGLNFEKLIQLENEATKNTKLKKSGSQPPLLRIVK